MTDETSGVPTEDMWEDMVSLMAVARSPAVPWEVAYKSAVAYMTAFDMRTVYVRAYAHPSEAWRADRRVRRVTHDGTSYQWEEISDD